MSLSKNQEQRTKKEYEFNLEEGTVGALSPQALRARFILAVGFIDLQVLHLQRKQEETLIRRILFGARS